MTRRARGGRGAAGAARPAARIHQYVASAPQRCRFQSPCQCIELIRLESRPLTMNCGLGREWGCCPGCSAACQRRPLAPPSRRPADLAWSGPSALLMPAAAATRRVQLRNACLPACLPTFLARRQRVPLALFFTTAACSACGHWHTSAATRPLWLQPGYSHSLSSCSAGLSSPLGRTPRALTARLC